MTRAPQSAAESRRVRLSPVLHQLPTEMRDAEANPVSAELTESAGQGKNGDMTVRVRPAHR